MKKLIVFGTILALVIGTAKAQDFASDLNKLGTDFQNGPLTNILFIAGANINESTHRVGEEIFVGYNLGKPNLPFEPYIVPFFGVANIGHLYGVSATATLNKDFYPFRMFQGGGTNNFAHNFRLTLFGVGGVGTDIAGEQFAGFTVPGQPNGKGAAAITGYGVWCPAFRVGDVKLGAYASRTDWTTVDGKLDFFGMSGKYEPKHLEMFFGM